MDGASFITLFREETMDQAEGQLWSDELILRYFDEAQIAFCRQTEGIPDRMLVTAAAGSDRVRLSPKILKVRAARLVGKHEMELLSIEEAGMPTSVLGEPKVLILGQSKGMAEVRPAPVTDMQIVLDVFRLPKGTITSAGDESEVDDIYITDLLAYALYRAYSRPDPDTMDRTRADYFREQFDLACRRVMREQGRARKPNGVTNFSW